MRSCPCRSDRLFFLVLIAAAITFSFPRALAQSALANHLPKRIVGDYGYWSKYQTPPYGHAQIPYNMLTHINHAGMSFNADGTLVVPDGFVEPELNDEAHAHGLKVLLLLGGDFTGLEASGAALVLVYNISAFEQQYHYDGVDLDWEYPATTGDRKFFVELMQMLRDSNPHYTLSIDAPPWGGYGYDLKDLQLSTDYFNIMMYDCAGPWTAHGQLNSPIFWDHHDPAPYECQPGGSAQEAANIFLKTVPATQLNMGTPFYGYYYSPINQLFEECPASVLNNPNNDGECGYSVWTVNYGTQVKYRINRRGWQTSYDPVAYVPYMIRTDGEDGYITYDDSFSTYFRVWYSDWDRGLGGTFMWSLDADYDGYSQDLLSAMYSATVTGP
jgi:chitinase